MIKNLDNEVWKVHPTFTDYAASNFGRIKHLANNKGRKEKLIKASPNDCGYLHFNIRKNGKVLAQPLAHRFVFECMNQCIIPKDIKKYQINHLNEIKTDNRIENLELCTAKENCNYGTRNERVALTQSKRVGQYTLDGELIKIWKSTAEAERNGYNQGAVAACCRNCFNRESNNIYKDSIWQFI